MTLRPLLALAVLLAVGPSGRLAAQASQFGIRGLGTPGKPESVRARSTGGAFAPFDAFSPLSDASLADARRMSASLTGGMSWRSLNPGADGTLRGTRFPALVIAGPVTRRIVIAGGFSTYLDRTFGITNQDTIILRGVPQAITDNVTSDGAVTDLRLAAAARVQNRLAIGLGFHLITGSSRVVATRSFADTLNYRTSTSRDEVAYGGIGGSVSAMLDVRRDFRLAGWLRSDTRLRADIAGRTVAENDLPFSYGGAVLWRAGAQAGVAGSVAWHKWAGAGPNAHDTFNWSFGAELGPVGTLFRAGVRGGQLAFGVGTTPKEFGYSGGIGRQFAGGRGRLDLGIERLERKGTGLTERVWTFLVGLTVRP
jgi:hypothetical protein